MKIILNHTECIYGEVVVEGTTEIGRIKGIWKKAEEPEKGKIYSVELDIESLSKKQVWVEHGRKKPDVCTKGDYVWFLGQCEEIDEVYLIRFALDWLEMIELEGEHIVAVGDWILFCQKYDQISIYPY